jgi:hypothetical protein
MQGERASGDGKHAKAIDAISKPIFCLKKLSGLRMHMTFFIGVLDPEIEVSNQMAERPINVICICSALILVGWYPDDYEYDAFQTRL